MKFFTIILLLISQPIFATLEVYDRPSDQEVFDGSDIVAIVRTTSGEVIPLEQGGGIKVVVEVLYPVKGIERGDEIEIYYGAGSIGGRYVATLVWDNEINGYKYFDPNMDYELFEINTIKQDFLDPQEISEARGLKGKVENTHDGIYFLPICDIRIDEDCQAIFDQVQYLVRMKNNMYNNALKEGTPKSGAP